MPVTPDEFRDAARFFASGVTIVTVDREGRPHGLTATSFASVSLDPPLVFVALDKRSRTRAMVGATKRFAVNILHEDQEAVAKAFAVSGDKDFTDVPHHLDEAGVPLLDEAIATMSCRVIAETDGGDHDVLIGEVLATTTRLGRPLLYHDRSYRRFDQPPSI